MQVTYWYPYLHAWSNDFKYGVDYESTATALNGWWTKPLVPKTPIPNVSRFKLYVRVDAAATTIFNDMWSVYINTKDGWEEIMRFSLPNYKDNGKIGDYERYMASITFDIELPAPKTIIKVATLPLYSMPYGVWQVGYDIEEAEITEEIPDAVLSDSEYFCGIHAKTDNNVWSTQPKKVDVNIGDKLTSATEIMTNLDGELVALPKMKLYNFIATTSEQSAIITFTPTRTGQYTIDSNTHYAGSTNQSRAEFKVFDSEMNELLSTYGTNATIHLEEGNEYRIIVFDSPDKTDLAQRVIKIYST